MLSSQNHLNTLCQTIYDLLVDLGEIFTKQSEKEDLTQIEFFYKKLHQERVLKYSEERLMPYVKQIKKRQISYFEKNIDLVFAGLEKDRVNYYKEIVLDKESERLSQDDFNVIWAYLDAMIASIELYKKFEKEQT
jgi:hypothetical protein